MGKSKITIIAVILILVLEVCLYFVAGTYSRYVSTADSSSSARTAKWAVKIGNVDLAGGAKDFSQELTLDTTNSEKVATGTIAPNTKVQGTFRLDPNGSEVAIEYTISLGQIYYKKSNTSENVTENTPNIEVTNVSVSTGTLTNNGNGSYTGYIALNGEAVDVTITAEWKSENNDEDNAKDTANGYTTLDVIIPITVTVAQDV
jgi:hypothetical protein